MNAKGLQNLFGGAAIGLLLVFILFSSGYGANENTFPAAKSGDSVSAGLSPIAAAPHVCEGDFEPDGDVDGSDLSVFALDFGRTDCCDTGQPPCEGDFDGDCDIDGSDLAIFARDFGRTGCFNTIVIGEAGGTFEFPNGVVLQVPPGALTQATAIEVTDVECSQVDEILSAHNFDTHEIRCLGGFAGKPDGLEFLLPVTAIIPIPQLEPGEMPVQFKADLDARKYHLAPTNFQYLGQEGVAKIEILEFSTNLAGGMITDEATEWTVPLPPCCAQKPMPADCCCLIDMKAVSNYSGLFTSVGSPSDSKDCSIAAMEVTVTMPNCPGQPQQTSWVQEISEDCPEMTCDIDVLPAAANLFVCQEEKLNASITCEALDGTPVPFASTKFAPFWHNDNPFAAHLDPRNGTVSGLKEGVARIKADWGIPDPNITPGEAVVSVISNIDSFSVTPDRETITMGDGIIVEAEGIDAEGNPLDTSKIRWSSSNPDIGYVTMETGGWTSVQGLNKGTVIITAEYTFDCETVLATAVITVGCVDLELSVTEAILALDGFLPVAVSVVDANGAPYEIPESEITWTSSNPGVAAVIPSAGSLVTIIANAPGTATITASYDQGSCGKRKATVLITVQGGIAGLWHLSPISQSEMCRYVGDEWWPEEDVSDFDVQIVQSVGEDDYDIEATYVPDTGTVMTGTWSSSSGDFSLSTDTAAIDECGYLFYWDGGADLCGDAVDCRLESCRITMNVSGTTSPTVLSLAAESSWYYAVTFSYQLPDARRGQTTWECQGSATLQGSR
jgi:hypothetical protein